MGAGPTFVILRQEGPWTYGMLSNHVWSFGGDSDRPDVSQTFIQPFLSYMFPDGLTLAVKHGDDVRLEGRAQRQAALLP